MKLITKTNEYNFHRMIILRSAFLQLLFEMLGPIFARFDPKI